MNIVGIIALSVCAAVFGILLLGGIGLQIWLTWQQRKQIPEAKREAERIYAETKAMLESTKASFAQTKAELTRMLEQNSRDLAATLERNAQAMQAGIDKINAEALQSAAARSIQACMRLEKAAGVIQSLFLENQETVTHEYPAEAFGPEESTFGGPPSQFSLSQTAEFDAQADAETAQAESWSVG